jgi:hypothetical protein
MPCLVVQRNKKKMISSWSRTQKLNMFTTTSIFHSPKGDILRFRMHKTMCQTAYAGVRHSGWCSNLKIFLDGIYPSKQNLDHVMWRFFFCECSKGNLFIFASDVIYLFLQRQRRATLPSPASKYATKPLSASARRRPWRRLCASCSASTQLRRHLRFCVLCSPRRTPRLDGNTFAAWFCLNPRLDWAR